MGASGGIKRKSLHPRLSRGMPHVFQMLATAGEGGSNTFDPRSVPGKAITLAYVLEADGSPSGGSSVAITQGGQGAQDSILTASITAITAGNRYLLMAYEDEYQNL